MNYRNAWSISKTIRHLLCLLAALALVIAAVTAMKGCSAAKPDEIAADQSESTPNAKPPTTKDSHHQFWRGLVMVSDDKDFDKRRVVAIQSFDTWSSEELRIESAGKNIDRGYYRSFSVPQELTQIPIRFVRIWNGPWTERNYVTADLVLERSGETCTFEVPAAEMFFGHGLNPCMSGVCGRIFHMELEVEPLSMRPMDVCLRMLNSLR